MKLTTLQNERANELRDAGTPAEWAILVVIRADQDKLRRKADAFTSQWMIDAFFFDSTPEGHDFWYGAYEGWCEEQGENQ